MALATPGSRLAAFLIDRVIYGVPIVIAFGSIYFASEVSGRAWIAAIGALALLAVFIVVQMVLLGTRGQTLGKIALNIRVVDYRTGEHAGFARLVLLRVIVNTLIGGVVPLYGLVDALFIFREDRRCIHDHIAGTRVEHVDLAARADEYERARMAARRREAQSRYDDRNPS